MKKLFIVPSSEQTVKKYTILDEKGYEKYIVLKNQTVYGEDMRIFENSGLVLSKIIMLLPETNLIAFLIKQTKKQPKTLVLNPIKKSIEILGQGIYIKGLRPHFIIIDKKKHILASQKEAFPNKGYMLEIFNDDFEILALSAAICINSLPTALEKGFLKLNADGC